MFGMFSGVQGEAIDALMREKSIPQASTTTKGVIVRAWQDTEAMDRSEAARPPTSYLWNG